MVRIYTAGHSNRTLAVFVTMLRDAGIEELVDVRAHPGSRRNPQFNQQALYTALGEVHIRYHWAGKHLGGMRKATADSPHLALPISMRGYAEHMRSGAFMGALQQLRRLADHARVSIMCAERDPLNCHRSLIADRLLSMGDRVTHLLSAGARIEHRCNDAARITVEGLVYDRLTQGGLDLD